MSDDEEVEDEDDSEELVSSFSLLAPGGLHIIHLSRLFIIRALMYMSLSLFRNRFSHLYARRLRPFLV